jgi:hypothetical protein
MQAESSSAPARRETVARFRSLESGYEFLVTGKFDDAGIFILDEEVEAMAGPFVTWEIDGTVSKFLGLENMRIAEEYQ